MSAAMDSNQWSQVDRLLQSALEHPSGERDQFLREACAGNEALEREVRSLLLARKEAGNFLESPAIKVAAQALANQQVDTQASRAEQVTAPERPLPTEIGRYRIVRLLGEGGMGVVYEAVQGQPHRTVALKVVKPGLDGSLLRRFEHESQALARLQHPGIAHIYDAGVADTGLGPQPYFAMEFIRGETLGNYVQSLHLPVRERLALMVKICRAVDHAHQRGLIHRDLKPGNILVDETGQPKILDFGVARVTDNELQVTRQTDVGQLLGTLEYMSPEQVLADPEEIDTRSDVYSLGVILYEILSGRRPYKLKRHLHDSVQTIREEDPTPLSSVSRDYRGDIETIVAKALEKDKERRYGSAAALASDIEHYLMDEPITARPASAVYHLQKFARRHKALVAGVMAVFAVLTAGVVASSWEASRARQERDRAATAERRATEERDRALSAEKAASAAKAQALDERNRALAEQRRADTEAATAKAVNEFLQNDLLAQASSTVQAGGKAKPDPDLKVRTALDRAAARIAGKFGSQPLVEASLRQTIGSTYLDLGLYPEAQREIQLALDIRKRALGEQDPATLQSSSALADALRAQGKYAESEALYTRVLTDQRRVLGEAHHDTLATTNKLIAVLSDETKYAQASELVSRSLAIQRRSLGEGNRETLQTLLNQAALARDLGKLPEAEALVQKVLEIQRRTLGEEHPDTLATMERLALQYREAGKFKDSESTYAHVFEIRKRVLGKEHPDTLETMNGVALAYRINGKFAQAEELFTQALEIERRTLGEEHPITVMTMGELPGVFWVEGKYTEAEPLYIKVLEIRRRTMGEEQDDTVSTMNNLATLYMSEGKFVEAEPLLVKVVEVRTRVRGADNPRTLISMNNLALLYRHLGRYSQSEALFSKVLETRRRVLGEDSPDTLKTVDALGSLYEVEGNYAKAEPLLTKVVEDRRRVLGERHPDTLLSMSNLALLYRDQHKYSQAEPLLQQVLENRRSVLGSDHPDTISTLSSMGGMRLLQERCAEAEPLLREALTRQEKKLTDTWERYNIQSMLGAALAGQGKYDEAEPLLLSGYEGLLARESRIPAPNRSAVDRAGQRIIQLYENWAKPEAAAEWRGKLQLSSAKP
jgi:tRNA A-37 threonylcarbamoyl transferase component Bud32